jgi:hypothetical protein
MKILILVGLILILVMSVLKSGKEDNYTRCNQSYCIQHTPRSTIKESKRYCKIHPNKPED